MATPVVDPVSNRASRRPLKKRSDKADSRDSSPSRPNGNDPIGFDASQRQQMIREAAYFRAQHRGFVPEWELEDWLAAEQQVDLWLTSAAG